MNDSPASQPLPRVVALTPPGRGAIASLLVEDNGELLDRPGLFSAVNGTPVSEQAIGRVCLGQWGEPPGEDVILCRTGPGSLELHCHGGIVPTQRITDDLVSAGAIESGWSEHLQDRQGILETELAKALAAATTWTAAAILLEQHAGVLREEIERVLAIAWLERDRAAVGLAALQRWSHLGIHLSRPWSVVLTGRPNVGKSSLLNALLGFGRAIVLDEAGTTRDLVTASTALQGWTVQFCDTAGIRSDAEGVEEAGISQARQQLAEADCRLVVLDRSTSPHPEDLGLLEAWPDPLVIANKSDLDDAWGDELPGSALSVSALTGHGVEELVERIVQRLVPEVPPPGTAVPVSAKLTGMLRQAARAIEENDETSYREILRGCL